MENSYGKYGVELVPYGPYQLPLKSWQYHIGNFQSIADDCPNPTRATPNPTPATRTTPTPSARLERPTSAPTERATFDNRYYVSAGQDESATWQEFGEMRFTGPETVSDAFGPKAIDPLHARATGHDPVHPVDLVGRGREHLAERQRQQLHRGRVLRHGRVRARALPQPRSAGQLQQPVRREQQRTAGGMWDMMSRGSFNGPGGQHTRWMIPPTQGGALGAQHGIRNKQKLNFVAADDVVTLNRSALAATGTAVVEVKAREVAPGDDIAGVRVLLDNGGDTNPPCRYQTDPMCEARGTRRRPAPTSPRLRRLHDGSRAADRLGLVHGRQRRAARQEQDDELVLRFVQLPDLVHRRQPAGHQPGRLRQG